MRVELTGGATRGATIFDRRLWAAEEAEDGFSEIEAITGVDAPRYRRLMAAALGVEDMLGD